MSDIINPTAHQAGVQAADDAENRGNATKLEGQTPVHVTLMNIDETIINYMSDVIKPSVTDNEILKLVPVLYATPERWSAFREHGVIRDVSSDKIQTPLIMIKRSNVERGKLSNPSNKYLETSYETGWNARNAYDKFSVLNNIRPSRQFHAVVIPDYVTITYEVILWTEYESQMSDLIGQIQMEGDEYWGNRNDYKFKVKIDSFDSQSELEASQDRVVRSTFQMKVNAYLIPERMVKNFKIGSTTKQIFTSKKVVTIVETTGTTINEGTEGPGKRRFP
jgi:hypothetical protein